MIVDAMITWGNHEMNVIGDILDDKKNLVSAERRITLQARSCLLEYSISIMKKYPFIGHAFVHYRNNEKRTRQGGTQTHGGSVSIMFAAFLACHPNMWNLSGGEVVVDIGSGNGQIPFLCSFMKLKNLSTHGIELDADRVVRATAEADKIDLREHVKPTFLHSNFLNRACDFLWGKGKLRLFFNNSRSLYAANGVQEQLAVILCTQCMKGTILVTLDVMFFNLAQKALWFHTQYTVQDQFSWNCSVQSHTVHVYVRNGTPFLTAGTRPSLPRSGKASVKAVPNGSTTRSGTHGMCGACPFSSPAV